MTMMIKLIWLAYLIKSVKIPFATLSHSLMRARDKSFSKDDWNDAKSFCCRPVFWAHVLFLLVAFSRCGSLPGQLRRVADTFAYCSQRRDFHLCVCASDVAVWIVWIPDPQRRYHHASEMCRTVTLRLRNVGIRRTAFLLSQLNSTDEKVLPFWLGELSATELQLLCWYELRRQVVC